MSYVPKLIAAVSVTACAGLPLSASAEPPLQTAQPGAGMHLRTAVNVTPALCAGLPLAAGAPKPPLQRALPGAEVRPISVARVMKVDGRIVLAGDWVACTGGFGSRSGTINAPFFDSFGREPGTALPGTVGTHCPTSCDGLCDFDPGDCGLRWYFGTGYHNPNTIEDMQDCACPPGSVISEIDLGWFWCPGAAENCIIVYFPYEEVLSFHPGPGLCTDPDSMTDTGGGGIALNFGLLEPGCPYFYWSRASGLEFLGALTPATDDNGDGRGFADGSYQMIVASAVTSSGFVLAGGPCQPMLWGTSAGWNGSISTGPADCRPGVNNDDSYDDDNPADGVLDNPGECYAYNYGICPDPIGKNNAFCYQRCPADFNNDGFVDGIDSDSFNNTFEGLGPRPQSCADLNGDCFVDGIDADYFNNEFESACP